jgi:nucleoid-associated protein YgaU
MAVRGTGPGWTRWTAPLLLAVPCLLVAVACGSGPATPSRETPLPPLPSVTTTLAPTTTRVPFYDVQQGDNLQGIADKLGIAMADLAAANGITDPNKIQAGQRLTVPPPPAPPPAATTTAAP